MCHVHCPSTRRIAGHGEWNSLARPKLVEELLSVDIVRVACGPRHVLALAAGDGQTPGAVYAWGCGLHGRTGLGDEEARYVQLYPYVILVRCTEYVLLLVLVLVLVLCALCVPNRCKPTQVLFAEPRVRVLDVACGVDGSMLRTELGVYACGSNRHNKLGLNPRQGFLMAMKNIFTTGDTERALTPLCVKPLARYTVRALALGAYHTAALVDPHRLLTFGRNDEGQLGNGTTCPQQSLVGVKCLQDKHILVRTSSCTAMRSHRIPYPFPNLYTHHSHSNSHSILIVFASTVFLRNSYLPISYTYEYNK